MKKTFLLLVTIIFWMQISAQELDKLIVDNDTISCQLKISQQKGERVVSFKNSYQTAWNEIYADNADAAIVSGESLFVSVRLPDAQKKVWAKCFFDGTYKLLGYRGEFYIVEAGEVTWLKGGNKQTEEVVSKGVKVFIGQMILIFKDKIDYKFNLLSYDSKSLVLPLIEYHKANQLPYHDYNRYIEIDTDWSFSGGFSMDSYNLSNQPVKLVDITGLSPFVAANLNFNIPQLSNRFFFFRGN